MVAELVIGEWDDFKIDEKRSEHPCAWVHEVSERMRAEEPEVSVPATFALSNRLYPHALFVGAVPTPAPEIVDVAGPLAIAGPVIGYAAAHSVEHSTSIRRRLESGVLPVVDPARWSPPDETDPLYELEDAYSQSVVLGNDSWPEATPMAEAESRLLSWLARAEDECDETSGQQPARALAAERFIRQLAATMAKRSVGVRMGRHADEEYLAEYELAIRDADRLAELQARLKDLLSGRTFRANALGAFGQPENVDAGLVLLVSNPVSIAPIRPAPESRHDLPAHDLPAIPFASGRAIPLTFDLFLSLRLRDRGCAMGSMPASVRAALDRMKQLHAGEACRKESDFLAGDSYFQIDQKGRVLLTAEGSAPRFVGIDGS